MEVQRDRVLRAARRAFAEHGYDATTVASVAEEASVSRAVVYEAVGDKMALLAAVVDQVVGEVVAGFAVRLAASEVRASSPRDLVRSNLVWFFHALRDDPSIGAMVRLSGLVESGAITAGRPDPAPVEPLSSARTGQARRQIEDGLAALHQAMLPDHHTTSDHAARLLAAAVVSMTETVAFRSLEQDWPFDESIDLFTEVVMGVYRVTGSPEGSRAITALNRAAAEPGST